MRKQCKLLTVNRSQLYYACKQNNENDITIMNELRKIYVKRPFYGYRRMHAVLENQGYSISRKKVQRLMGLAELKAVHPKKKTTTRNPAHKTYPYLLKNVTIDKPNIAWEVDITYIKVKTGFVYLVGIIDVFSRKIMGWNVSAFLETKSCLDAYDKAVKLAKPIILNSDQGCQFTSEAWTSKMAADGIKISMDGRGRWADNIHIERFWRSIKYEAVFLQSFDSVKEACTAIAQYIEFYNQQRPHQALGYRTPDSIYQQYTRKNEREAKKQSNSKKECLLVSTITDKQFEDSQIQATFWS